MAGRSLASVLNNDDAVAQGIIREPYYSFELPAYEFNRGGLLNLVRRQRDLAAFSADQRPSLDQALHPPPNGLPVEP